MQDSGTEAERAGQTGALSAEERLLYDRQLRVWGADAQAKLKDANLLVLGACGRNASADIAGEVLKNVTLSGVGTITLCLYSEEDGARNIRHGGVEAEGHEKHRQDTPTTITSNSSGDGISLLEGMYRWSQTSEPPGIIPNEETVAMEGQKLIVALRDMNPLVNVEVLSNYSHGDELSLFDSSFLSNYQCVLILRKQFSFNFVKKMSKACRASKISCYMGEVRGEHGYFISDLGKHSFKEDQEDKKGAEIVVEYPPMEAVLEVPRSSLPRRAPQIASALKGMKSK